MNAGVYAIKNTVTGRHYVGSSIDLARRRRTHFRQLRAGNHKSVKLQNSWNKHGEAAFEFVVLELTSDGETAIRSAEQHWIDTFDAVAGGYNIAPVAGNVGRTPKTAEHRARIGAAHKGRKNTPEAIARMQEAAKRRAKPAPFSAEHRAKLAAAKRGVPASAEMKAKLSAWRTGRPIGPMSKEQKESIAAAKRGKPLSEHHKQRIREGQARRRQGDTHAS